jgi:hypothetical protein
VFSRTLRASWDALREEDDERGFDYERNGAELLELGEVFSAFSDYSLERGAELLESLADTTVVHEYEPEVRHAIRFLENQQHEDGTYGAWADEKFHYTAADEDNTVEQFETELLEPLAEKCDAAVDAVRTAWETNEG